MAHLHEHNVLHRDLAVRNVMLKEGSGKLVVKVGPTIKGSAYSIILFIFLDRTHPCMCK